MKVLCKIRDSRGERSLGEHDFPVLIGGSLSAGIRIAGLGEHEEASYIGWSEGRFYVQAAEMGIPVWHNGERLKGSVFLRHGDRLQIGPSQILFKVEDDGMVFQVTEPGDASKTIPPVPSRPSDSSMEIEPVSFHPSHQQARPKFPLRGLAWLILILIFSILSASAWFVFTARQVVISIEPEPDQITIRGGIVAPRWGAYYLLRPGEYTLTALKRCYEPLSQSIKVAGERSQTLKLQMEKLPGVVSLRAYQEEQSSVEIEGARIHIDGEEVGTTPVQELKVRPGRRSVEIFAKNYQDLKTHMDVEGCGVSQTLQFALLPAWGDVTIGSIPQGAMVMVDGKEVGETPLTVQLLPGTYRLEVNADRYKTWRTQLTVKPNEPQVLDNIKLLPADGILVLSTRPPGANVTVGGEYAGKTPLKIPLAPKTTHVVHISKAGYEKTTTKIGVSSAKEEKLTVELVPIKGVLYVMVEPKDAELFVNGKSWGPVRPELRLIAVEHQLEIRKEGYESFLTKITPRPGFPQEVRVALKKKVPEKVAPPSVIKTHNGYSLRLIKPGFFTMGASRREQGRRSNETLRRVELKRPFYMGVREVTNKEFREYLAEHHSGWFKKLSLNRDEMPVVEVIWEQAALFCNWLSAKASLPPSYVKRDGKWVAAEPMGGGYRLPTEAEWEYCARYEKDKPFLKYPWGNDFPPTGKSGNFADASAKDLLPNYLPNYDDGYPGPAPPGVFKPNSLGLYDLGGNVAEWCHDYYTIYAYSGQKAITDPLGPMQGAHRVVKGSSWKDSSISALRLAYRDYSNGKRPDVGFRVCRYSDDVREKK
ncbi:MAG: PEGA domain-containing protein [Deltaproteobacteria bacterium]|nr:MAG: PEGA domain-containing protein [Deltaproteobacteria bacterium]